MTTIRLALGVFVLALALAAPAGWRAGSARRRAGCPLGTAALLHAVAL